MNQVLQHGCLQRLGDAHVALRGLGSDAASRNHGLHRLVEKHSAGETVCDVKTMSAA